MKKIISIITSTFNAANSFPKLIASMREAKRPEIQWIVVDGNSNDGTVELAYEARDVIDQLISEPDTGIYQAWNKGLKFAAGNYIAFIGADDYLAENYFDEALSSIDDEHNVIGFKFQVVNFHSPLIVHNKDWERPWNYPINLGFHQQGTLHAKELFTQGAFNETFKIIGDRDFLTRNSECLKPKIHPTPTPLIFFSFGGASSNPQNIKIIYQELFKLIKAIPHKKIIVYLELFNISLKMMLVITGLHKYASAYRKKIRSTKK